ncbi:MAG: RND family transporter [Endomicrobiales bacterium]|nr:RND family transporter [Endomicrobiales bacterium]
MKKSSEFIVKYRWFIIAAFILVPVLFATQIPRAVVEPNMKSMLPKHMAARIATDRIDEIFGGTEIIAIMIKTDDVLNPSTLKRIRKLNRKMKHVHNIDKVLSLFELKNIKGENGAMIVDPAVKEIPSTDEEREALRDELKDNDIVYGSVVSKDFTVTAVIGMLESSADDMSVLSEIEELVKEVPGDEETVIGGLPYTRVKVAYNIRNDMKRLMPYGFIIMLVFLYLCFKQARGVVLPFVVVVMSILVTMGVIPVLGWKIYVITVLVPVILIAVANDYGIHLIAKYQELIASGVQYSNKEIAKKMYSSLSKPVIMTGLTTIAGMLCLLNHIIIPAKQVGILAAVGIFFALSASLLFIPAVTAVLPAEKTSSMLSAKPHLLDRILISFGEVVALNPKKVITIILACALAASTGIFRVIVDTDPVHYFSKESPVAYSANIMNEKFGGQATLSVVVKGDIKSPDIMHQIENIEEHLKASTYVGQATSIARIVKQMSRALNDKNDRMYNKIPDSRNAIAQYFELYSMSGDPDDFEKLVDFPYEHAHILARINSTSVANIRKIVTYAENMKKDNPNIDIIGGFAMILEDLATHIVQGQMRSLVSAIIIVMLLVALLFRSAAAGFLSAVPIGISIILLFGLMGYAGIELNVATAMLSSIMIGVGIDYTIHFLWRYKEEMARGLEPQEAVKTTLKTTGRGIVFNALSVVVGFSVLLLSTFVPVNFFGFLVVVSILSCLFGALLLVPALCIVLRPAFLEPKKNGIVKSKMMKK